jgi:hypothetical protein
MPLVTDGNVDRGRHMYKDGRTARMNNKADDTTVYSPAGAHPSGPLQLEASCAVAFHMRAAIQSALLAHVPMHAVSSPPHLAYDRAYIDPFRTCRTHAPNRSCRMPFVMRLHNYQLLKQPISEML